MPDEETTAQESNENHPMRSWHKHKDRVAAKEDFVRELKKPENAEIRRRCAQEPHFARQTFARFGRFYIEGEAPAEGFPPFDSEAGLTAIPAETEIRVWEQDDTAARDQLVTLVLPSASGQPEPVDSVWRCTYTPYAV